MSQSDSNSASFLNGASRSADSSSSVTSLSTRNDYPTTNNNNNNNNKASSPLSSSSRSGTATKRILSYPRDFFKKGEMPKTIEAAALLWPYRKDRPKENSPETQPSDGMLMYQEMKQMRTKLVQFVTTEFNQKAIAVAQKLNLRYNDCQQLPSTRDDLQQLVLELDPKDDNSGDTLYRLLYEPFGRRWLSNTINKWLTENNMRILPPPEEDPTEAKKKRKFQDSLGGFTDVGREGMKVARDYFRNKLWNHMGWNIASTSPKGFNNNPNFFDKNREYVRVDIELSSSSSAAAASTNATHYFKVFNKNHHQVKRPSKKTSKQHSLNNGTAIIDLTNDDYLENLAAKIKEKHDELDGNALKEILKEKASPIGKSVSAAENSSVVNSTLTDTTDLLDNGAVAAKSIDDTGTDDEIGYNDKHNNTNNIDGRLMSPGSKQGASILASLGSAMKQGANDSASSPAVTTTGTTTTDVANNLTRTFDVGGEDGTAGNNRCSNLTIIPTPPLRQPPALSFNSHLSPSNTVDARSSESNKEQSQNEKEPEPSPSPPPTPPQQANEEPRTTAYSSSPPAPSQTPLQQTTTAKNQTRDESTKNKPAADPNSSRDENTSSRKRKAKSPNPSPRKTPSKKKAPQEQRLASDRKKTPKEKDTCNHNDPRTFQVDDNCSYYSTSYISKRLGSVPSACEKCEKLYGISYKVTVKNPVYLCFNAKLRKCGCIASYCEPCYKSFLAEYRQKHPSPKTNNRTAAGRRIRVANRKFADK